MSKRRLSEGDILSAKYIREHFILSYMGVENYVSKDGMFCCRIYRDGSVSELERYE